MHLLVEIHNKTYIHTTKEVKLLKFSRKNFLLKFNCSAVLAVLVVLDVLTKTDLVLFRPHFLRPTFNKEQRTYLLFTFT